MTKRQSIIFITAFAFSALILLGGILSLVFSCDGSCGATNHGGMLTWVCPQFWMPMPFHITVMIIGGVGIIATTVIFIWQLKKRDKTEL